MTTLDDLRAQLVAATDRRDALEAQLAEARIEVRRLRMECDLELRESQRKRRRERSIEVALKRREGVTLRELAVEYGQSHEQMRLLAQYGEEQLAAQSSSGGR